MYKIFIFIFCIFFLSGCDRNNNIQDTQFKPAENYPRWLTDSSYSTNQTSGISFIGIDNKDRKTFLLADDIGELHHLKISNDTIFNLSKINFAENILLFLSEFPKKDFEEIAYDKYTSKVYLSIEGNGPDPKKYAGIYELLFKNKDVFSDSIIGLEKLNITPQNKLLKYIDNNIGFEGLAVDENYFYLGLEGFREENVFADSTIIFVVDKKNLNIVKEINTKPLNIYTICGLYSDKNFSIYGIDRNNKSIFHILLNENLNVEDFKTEKIESNIPDYHMFDYVASLESITMDDGNNFYLIDDPWKQFFIPQDEILNKLDSKTINNFKNFVPIIFKFGKN